MKVFVGSSDVNKRPYAKKGDEPFTLTATSGQMLKLPKGNIYRYNFPGPATYVAICLPAFSPEIAGRIE